MTTQETTTTAEQADREIRAFRPMLNIERVCRLMAGEREIDDGVEIVAFESLAKGGY